MSKVASIGLAMAGLIMIAFAFVLLVIPACLLVPVQWIIENEQRRKMEGNEPEC